MAHQPCNRHAGTYQAFQIPCTTFPVRSSSFICIKLRNSRQLNLAKCIGGLQMLYARTSWNHVISDNLWNFDDMWNRLGCWVNSWFFLVFIIYWRWILAGSSQIWHKRKKGVNIWYGCVHLWIQLQQLMLLVQAAHSSNIICQRKRYQRFLGCLANEVLNAAMGSVS